MSPNPHTPPHLRPSIACVLHVYPLTRHHMRYLGLWVGIGAAVGEMDLCLLECVPSGGGGGGGQGMCVFYGCKWNGISIPLLTIASSTPEASTLLTVLVSFTLSSQTTMFGACSPPLIWQGGGVGVPSKLSDYASWYFRVYLLVHF